MCRIHYDRAGWRDIGGKVDLFANAAADNLSILYVFYVF